MICCYHSVVRRACQIKPKTSVYTRRSSSSATNPRIEDILSKPSWSVKSLQAQNDSNSTAKISQKQLHHLLRLSALPLPKTAEEEAKMIQTLESQLHFVQAVQSVDTTGVEPLRSIRDETEAAEKESEINLESVKDILDKEEIVGVARRIQRKAGAVVNTQGAEDWDVLAQAPKKIGRYIVVKTKP